MDLQKIHTRMYVRTNADTPHDAQVARNFGAKVLVFVVLSTCSSKAIVSGLCVR
jgi:hypothetical protein